MVIRQRLQRYSLTCRSQWCNGYGVHLATGCHGFDPHRVSVLKITHKDTKYWKTETDPRAFKSAIGFRCNRAKINRFKPNISDNCTDTMTNLCSVEARNITAPIWPCKSNIGISRSEKLSSDIGISSQNISLISCALLMWQLSYIGWTRLVLVRITIANRSSSRQGVVGIVSAYRPGGHGFVIRCRRVL
ncbi:hypothetical protein DPMN_015209 [Dreissena polymorpha]|uniref:Uncharacterized protein n=1 Tax=Dreissena polymorpha TaxID=45954 RepID=A0A9D4S5A1_DREPO|nr:hypothetical protein DPMN_015209 [Dreissena polymorpha]